MKIDYRNFAEALAVCLSRNDFPDRVYEEMLYRYLNARRDYPGLCFDEPAGDKLPTFERERIRRRVFRDFYR